MKKFDKTTLLLKDQLINYVSKNPDKPLNIKNYCDFCGVNRKTFYAHFSSIDELWETIIADKQEHLRSHYADYVKNDPDLNIQMMAYFFNVYMVEELELYTLVFSSPKYSYIFDRIFDYFCSILTPIFNPDLFESKSEMGIVIQSFAYALYSPYRYAVKSNISFKDTSLKRMTVKSFDIHKHIKKAFSL